MTESWFRELVKRARASDSPALRLIYRWVRWAYRVVGRTVWPLGLGWVQSIRRLRRTPDGWMVEGWAYHRGTDFGDSPEFTAWLVRRGKRRIRLSAETTYDMEARAAAKAAEYDYARNSFRVAVPDKVMESLPAGRWRIRVQIRGNRHRVRGWFQIPSMLGSAVVAGPRHTADALVGPVVVPEAGVFWQRRPLPDVVATSVDQTASGFAIAVEGRIPEAARWVGLDQESAALTVDPSGVLRGSLPRWVASVRDPSGWRRAWSIEVRFGQQWQRLAAGADLVSAATTAVVRSDSSGNLQIVDTPVHVIAEDVEFVPGAVSTVRVTGRFRGTGELQLAFRSRFETIPVDVTTDGDRFTATAALQISRWGGPLLPPPLGAYSLVAFANDRVQSTFIDSGLGERLPESYSTDEYRLRFTGDLRDQFGLRFGPPRTDAEFGAWRQLQMRERFTTGDVEPLDAVYFESFFGRNATCNPLAMDAELAQRHPDVPRYWGVQDRSIVVPPGAIPLVRGTQEWWRVRSSARWIVTNEWLRANFVKQPFQTVLQTWHGSMFKQIGLDRGGRGKAHMKIVDQERVKWDLFVSQAPETTPIIKGAYDLGDQVIECGYPRNGELREFSDESRQVKVRQRLGIPLDTTVVMYAPTWREDVQGEVELLDLEGLGPALGESFTLLHRGHVRSLANTVAARASNVLDVSTYPQINDLLGVADVLITDYSSMMFDFSVTGRPMIFYTPDIEIYTDANVRGSYFDLEERAPGPVTRDVREVVRLLRNLGSWEDQWAEKYRSWQQRYNVLDDGRAAERAVDALMTFHPHPHGRIKSAEVAQDDAEELFDSQDESPVDVEDSPS